MITRDVLPTSGVAYLSGLSVLSHFQQAALHLGIVCGNIIIWSF